MYEDIFKNSIGFNTAQLNIDTANGSIDLYYYLHDNPVQHQWQSLFAKDLKVIQGNSFGEDFDILYEDLKNYCSHENISIPNILDQKYLNKLHNKFVSSSNNDNWRKINHLIHLIENKLNSISSYDYSFNFYGNNSDKIELKEEHKLFLSSDSVWGRLNLGYATIGKDWQTISSNDDNDKDLHIQKYITTETYASFSPEEPFYKFREQKFYYWAINTNLDVPLQNLNELSFGRYFLGNIIITDVFLDYHKNASDWYVPNHQCKWNWNKDVLGSKININKIKFFDSDMCYNAFYNHTGITHA